MSDETPTTYVPPWVRAVLALPKRLRQFLADLGGQVAFYARSLVATPKGLRYRTEIARLVAEVSLGAGALAVVGGTVGVVVAVAFFTGGEVGLEGFKGLSLIGVESLSGFLSAFVNTREIAPLVTALALAAQVGCGFTAQLGAMRITPSACSRRTARPSCSSRSSTTSRRAPTGSTSTPSSTRPTFSTPSSRSSCSRS
jgi:ABC-type transporter Mla maintaining outer membrane lipid asymmetry permease subunit MlaE